MTGARSLPRRGGDHVAVVLGGRADVVGLGPVIRAFDERPVVIGAARAGDAGFVRAVLEDDPTARPDVALDVATGTTTDQLADLLAQSMRAHAPRAVVVHGDSPTASAAAQAAHLVAVPLVRVGAGRPCGDEVATTGGMRAGAVLSTVYTAATRNAARALRRGGVGPEAIAVTGSTIIESTREALQRGAGGRDLDHLPIHHGFALAAIGHPENLGSAAALLRVMDGLVSIEAPCLLVLEPRVAAALERFGLTSMLGGLVLVPALPRAQFLALARRAAVVVSDSDLVQEESTVVGTPLLVVRRRSERPEAVEAGFARLVAAGSDVASEANATMASTDWSDALAGRRSPYGDGHAGLRIAALAQLLADGATASEAVDELESTEDRAAAYPPARGAVPTLQARP